MNIAYIVDETSFFLPNILKEIIDVRNDNSNLIYIIKKIPKNEQKLITPTNGSIVLNIFEFTFSR